MAIIAVLHPGAMGAAVGAEAVRSGHTVRWAVAGRSATTTRRAEEAGLIACATVAEAVSDSEVVISLCPPAAAEQVSLAVARTGFAGVYLEANAISPGRTARICDLHQDRGAHAVDGAVIGPPPGRSARPRLYLAGPAAHLVADLFTGSSVDAHVLDQPLGAASALKMAYGGFTKASAALAAVSHALAHEFGVQDLLTAEGAAIEHSPLGRPEALAGLAARAWRWAPEMSEVADAEADLGLPVDLARAAAMVMERWDEDKDDQDLTLDEVLQRLRGPGRPGIERSPS